MYLYQKDIYIFPYNVFCSSLRYSVLVLSGGMAPSNFPSNFLLIFPPFFFLNIFVDFSISERFTAIRILLSIKIFPIWGVKFSGDGLFNWLILEIELSCESCTHHVRTYFLEKTRYCRKISKKKKKKKMLVCSV
jgi:hypothetical protein